MYVCDTTHTPSIHLYACIYRFRLIAFICIYYTSWGQVHIQQSATNISYTDISLCTGIHKNGSILPHKGIKIYAANAHYHQISRRKGLWQLPPPCPFTYMHMCQKRTEGRGGGMPGGINILIERGDIKKIFENWDLICNCLKKAFKKSKCLCNTGSSVLLNRFLKSPGSSSLKVTLYE